MDIVHYGARPIFNKEGGINGHGTFWHPGDKRPHMKSPKTLKKHLGKFVTIKVFKDTQMWKDVEGKNYEYRFCRYIYPDEREEELGHISQKVDINDGPPKHNKQHSEDTWDTFIETNPYSEYETYLSFGTMMICSQNLVDMSKAKLVKTVFDARDFFEEDGSFTSFCENIYKTRMKITIFATEDKISFLQDKFPTAIIVDVNQIKDMDQFFVVNEYKHLVSSQIQKLDDVYITQPSL